MSNKNFISKDNKIKLVNDLDDERMNNNIKKFNFILEDANSIKKKAKKSAQNESQIKEIKNRKTSQADHNEYFGGIKSIDDPSLFKFDNEENNFDKNVLSNESELDEERKKKRFSMSMGKETDVNFYEIKSDKNKILSDSNVKKEKLNLLIKDSLKSMEELNSDRIDPSKKKQEIDEELKRKNSLLISNDSNIRNSAKKISTEIINVGKLIKNEQIENTKSLYEESEVLILNDNKRDQIRPDSKKEKGLLLDNKQENQFSKNAKDILNNNNLNKTRDLLSRESSDRTQNKLEVNGDPKINQESNYKNQNSNFILENNELGISKKLSFNSVQDSKEKNYLNSSLEKKNIMEKSQEDWKSKKDSEDETINKDDIFLKQRVTQNLKELNIKRGQSSSSSKKVIENNNDRININNLMNDISNDKKRKNSHTEIIKKLSKNDSKNFINDDEEFGNINNNNEDENDKLIFNERNRNSKQNLNNSNYDEKQILILESSKDGLKDSLKFNTNDSKFELKKEEFIDTLNTRNFLKSILYFLENLLNKF